MSDQIAIVADPTISDLRAMVAGTAQIPVAEPEPEKVEEEAKSPLESGDASITNEPNESVEHEEPLPDSVRKRVEKIAAETARIEGEISRAISAKKAAQAELAKLTDTGKPGSEPVKTTEPAKEGRPKRPSFDEYTAEGKSFTEFKADEAKWETDHEAWLFSEADRRADERYMAKQREAEAKREWEAAEKEHPGFNAARGVVASNSPEALQLAISQLEGWKAVVAHLGKPENAAELKALSEKAEKSSFAAAADLGRLEDRLKATVQDQGSGNKPKLLPDPPKIVGGSAAATGKGDAETMSVAAMRKQFGRPLAS